MSPLFESVIDQARELPAAEQERLARLLLAELQLSALRRQLTEEGVLPGSARQGTIVF